MLENKKDLEFEYAHPDQREPFENIILILFIAIIALYFGALAGCFFWGKHIGEKKSNHTEYVRGYTDAWERELHQ